MSPAVAALVLLLPLAYRGPAGASAWAMIAALYVGGAVLSVALALALPGASVVLVLERVLIAAGLAALVALALRLRRREGPRAAWWLAHAGLVAALAAEGIVRIATTGRSWSPSHGDVAGWIAAAGLLAGAAGAAWTAARSR